MSDIIKHPNENHLVHICGCAIVKDGKLLLLKKFKNDYYEFPGGKLDSSETYEQAAIRECKEEIGCYAKIIRKMGEIDLIHKGKNVRAHVFLADIDACTPSICEPHIFERLIWMPLSQRSKYILASNVSYFCERYEKGL